MGLGNGDQILGRTRLQGALYDRGEGPRGHSGDVRHHSRDDLRHCVLSRPVSPSKMLTRVATPVLAVAVMASAPVVGHWQQPRFSSADTALRVRRWLDPASGQFHGPSAIVVSGTRIKHIVPLADFDQRSTKALIDLGAATVLPGLIDAHVHLTIGGTSRANAAAILRAGFTTVADLGATSDAVIRLRDAIASGDAEGPRILAAGLWVGTKNGICEFGGIGVDGGPKQFRARVRENVASGADLTKVCVSGWTRDAFAHPDAYEISDAALAAVVDESRRRGHVVLAHAISLGSVQAALRAGVDGLAHAAYLDAATATVLRDKGVFLVPTLASLLRGTQGRAGVALQESVAEAHRAGVRLIFGTDGGVLPHGENAVEFAALIEAGVPAIDAIRAATVDAADALGLATEIGTIDIGKTADLIAVDGDPLHDPTALSRVTFVMQSGHVARHERSAASARRPTIVRGRARSPNAPWCAIHGLAEAALPSNRVPRTFPRAVR
ncbi:MAG: amidohydrolase family protein [Luteitalea sp.]|nr:amidohydrolase family protein [Luteitalea sp.]